jgi:membrane protein required for colicin V production
MSWLDLVLVVVLAVGAFLGLRMGIIKAVLSLVGVIVGVVLAGRYYSALADVLPFFSETSDVAKIVSFAIILIVVMVIAVVAARFLKWAASVMMLSWVNHLGGAVFGLVLGAIFCGALLAIWVKWLGAGDTITESMIAPVLLDKFPMVLALLPDEFDAVRSFFQ